MITQRLPQPGGMGWQPGRGTKFSMFRAGDVLETETPAPTTRYWNASGAWLDQGNSSRCTIFAWSHVWEDGPIVHPGTITDAEMWRLYRIGQDIDHTPQSDVDSGLTSDAAAKAMQREGYIGEYRWALELDEAIEWLRRVGPATLGSWWTGGMDDPDTKGVATYTGAKLGGHQYKADGVNTTRKIIRFKNSWGRGWAKKGFFYMTFDTVARILADGGEFCMARELKSRAFSQAA